MKRVAIAVTCAGVLAAGVILSAQAPAPFKLGTFQLQNRTFIGIVVRDTQVIDFAAADSVIGRGRVAAPADMKQLIERYEAGVRDRIYAVVKAVTSAQGGARPAYVHDLAALKTMPPIMYPMTMLNAAVNYREHGEEMDRRAGQPQAAGAPPPGTALPGTQERTRDLGAKPSDTRWNPYVFLKSPSAIDRRRRGDPDSAGPHPDRLGVRARRRGRRPDGEPRAGRTGRRLHLRLHDREGRVGSRGTRRQSLRLRLADRQVARHVRADGSLHHTEGVRAQPAESAGEVHAQRQDDAGRDHALMIHDVFELVSYASNIITLRPGDVIATGSRPASVRRGSRRFTSSPAIARSAPTRASAR